MESSTDFSILLALGFLAAILAVAVIAVVTENSEETTGRLTFLAWSLAFMLVPSLVSAVAGTMASFVLALVMTYPVYQVYVRRARDAGMSKTIAYLSIVPLVSIVTSLILLFAPGVGNRFGEGRPGVFDNAA